MLVSGALFHFILFLSLLDISLGQEAVNLEVLYFDQCNCQDLTFVTDNQIYFPNALTPDPGSQFSCIGNLDPNGFPAVPGLAKNYGEVSAIEVPAVDSSYFQDGTGSNHFTHTIFAFPVVDEVTMGISFPENGVRQLTNVQLLVINSNTVSIEFGRSFRLEDNDNSETFFLLLEETFNNVGDFLEVEIYQGQQVTTGNIFFQFICLRIQNSVTCDVVETDEFNVNQDTDDRIFSNFNTIDDVEVPLKFLQMGKNLFGSTLSISNGEIVAEVMSQFLTNTPLDPPEEVILPFLTSDIFFVDAGDTVNLDIRTLLSNTGTLNFNELEVDVDFSQTDGAVSVINDFEFTYTSPGDQVDRFTFSYGIQTPFVCGNEDIEIRISPPTVAPTSAPSERPTDSPTKKPTPFESEAPTQSNAPSKSPTKSPTRAPQRTPPRPENEEDGNDDIFTTDLLIVGIPTVIIVGLLTCFVLAFFITLKKNQMNPTTAASLQKK